MADYPGAIPDLTSGVPSDGDAPSTPLGDDDYPHDDHHRDLGQEVEAIATELGTSPSGASVDVAARFAVVEAVADAAQTAGEVAAAVAAHEADTSVHGIADTTVLATDAEVAAAVAAEATLARNADNLTSGTVADARIASTIARDSEVTAAISAHEAASDPHTGYLTAAEGNAAYQPLDSDLTAVAGLTAPATQITDSTAHISDSTAAHAASAIAFTPDGSIAATNVQDAIEEVRDEAGSALAIGAAVSGQTDNTVLFTDASGNLDDGVLTIEQSTLFGLADFTQLTAPVASAGGPGWANATALGTPFDVSGWFLDSFDLFAVTNPANLKAALVILNDTPGTILAAGHFGIGLGGSNPASPSTSGIHLDVTQSDGSTDVTFGPAIDVLDFSGNVLTDIGNGSASSDAAAYGQIIPRTIIDAAGDLIVGTAADTAARLAMGSALQVLRVNAGATALEWATAGGGGTPGGSDTHVQYNDGGAFGGDAHFTFNETTNLLTLGASGVAGGILIPDISDDSYIAIGPQGSYGSGYGVEPHLAINTARLVGGGSDGILSLKTHTGAAGVFKTGGIYASTGYISANGMVGFSIGENFANTAATLGLGVTTSNNPQARLYLQPEAAHISHYAAIDGIRVKAQTSQTGKLFRGVNTSNAEVFGVDLLGGITPGSMADSAAANGTIYYSTTASKLVFKDSGGTVNALY